MLLKDALSIERTDINPILLHCVQSVIDEQSTVNRPCKRKDIWKQAKCECRCSRMSYLINVMSFESAEDYQYLPPAFMWLPQNFKIQCVRMLNKSSQLGCEIHERNRKRRAIKMLNGDSRIISRRCDKNSLEVFFRWKSHCRFGALTWTPITIYH